jgi:SAM-dependent methyltransferase
VSKYEELVDSVIEEQRAAPVDMLDNGGGDGEIRYLEGQRDAFIRTVRDVDEFLGGGRKRILEIGSFLGAVSISLQRLGYEVVAVDIPEFHRSARLRGLYERHGVQFLGANLRGHTLPFEAGRFDAVIACEIFEHLNFNPLPLVQELNRITAPGGLFYLAMPNQASLFNRLRMLTGKSVLEPVSSYFAQLDRSDNMIVGLHWREYTMAEARELMTRMGYEPLSGRYVWLPNATPAGAGRWLRRLLFLVPSFRPFQVVMGRKREDARHDFWITEANA